MILVTGGTGLVGGHLLIHLYRKGIPVRALIRKTSSFKQLRLIVDYYQEDWDMVENAIEWVYGDMTDEESVAAACENIHTVYHCAAVVSFDATDRNALNRINVEGTESICRAAMAKGIQRFCMVSSIAAIGPCRPNQEEADESCQKKESDAGSDYSVSKYQSEEIVLNYIRKGLPAVIVNPGVILGAGLLDRGSMKIYETVKKGIPFYTNGGTGYVDVRDVANVMIRLADLDIKGERYILVAQNATYGELFFAIADAIGVRRPFLRPGKLLLSMLGGLSGFYQRLSGRKVKYTKEVMLAALNRKYYSSDKIKSLLDFEFIPMNESVKDITAWLRRTDLEKALPGE
ncbi:MAG: NAD-dependent epimerase/dehydratase family protein [Bacteroidales bacterium]